MQPTADAQTALGAWHSEGACAYGRFRFSAGLPVFRGHFPGGPLLPGVYHLAAMARLTAVALPDAQLQLVLIERAKWSAPAFPERELEVAVTWKMHDVQLIVDGTVQMEGVMCASARLCFSGVGLPG